VFGRQAVEGLLDPLFLFGLFQRVIRPAAGRSIERFVDTGACAIGLQCQDVLKAMRYSQVKNWESPLKRSNDW
jgi:hypothetical protein